ncbi:MAG: helix-turn-helix domain-containing protein [Phycisphaerales bacterium]
MTDTALLFDVLHDQRTKILPVAAKLVLVYLAWRQGDNGEAWPAIATMADDLGLAKHTVLDSVNRLCESGLIVKTPGQAGRGHSHRYALTAANRCNDDTFSGDEKGAENAPIDSRKRCSHDTYSGREKVQSPHEKVQPLHLKYPEGTKEQKSARNRTPFTPPTVAEVAAYATERGYPDFDADHFVTYYTENEWRDKAGNPVRSWKGKVLTWGKRDQEQRKTTTTPKREPQRGDPDWYPTDDEVDRVMGWGQYAGTEATL